LAYLTHETEILAEGHDDRKIIKKPPRLCNGLLVAFSKFAEGPFLFFESLHDGVGGIAALESRGEWMFSEVYSRLLFILLQSRLKFGFEDRGFRGGGHHRRKWSTKRSPSAPRG